MKNRNGSMLAALIVIPISILNIIAVYNELHTVIGLSMILSIALSLIASYLPVVCQVLGILGAVNVWHWSVPVAIGVFVASGMLITFVGYDLFRDN